MKTICILNVSQSSGYLSKRRYFVRDKVQRKKQSKTQTNEKKSTTEEQQ